MFLKSLKVKDFRNYADQNVEFMPGVNIFSGNNAQGKTNLLEAVYICSVGRSPRTPRDKEMIRWGCDRAKIDLDILKKSGQDNVKLIIDKIENKRIAINNMPISRIGELMGVVTTVFFAPDELKIIKDAPGDRRKFMDISLSQISKNYFYLLSRYNKVLAQRNRLLKNGNTTDETLDIWDSQLLDYGSKIIFTRKEFIKRINVYAQKVHFYLTESLEELELIYEGLEGENPEAIKNDFSSKLLESRERDKTLGNTRFGPQRDDIKIIINNTDCRVYGSQGQQRTASLSIKIAELKLLEENTGESPILLLDDVLSELDNSRCFRLLKLVSKYQTILTCTDIRSSYLKDLDDYRIFQIEKGNII